MLTTICSAARCVAASRVIASAAAMCARSCPSFVIVAAMAVLYLEPIVLFLLYSAWSKPTHSRSCKMTDIDGKRQTTYLLTFAASGFAWNRAPHVWKAVRRRLRVVTKSKRNHAHST